MFVSVQHQFEISQAFNRELLKQIFFFFLNFRNASIFLLAVYSLVS